VTLVKDLLIIMADGKRRTKHDVAKEMGLSPEEAHRVLRTAMSGSNIQSHQVPVYYTITEHGQAEAVRRPLKQQTLERKARERRERAIRAAEAAERKKEEAERASQAGSITYRAKTGQIANSVFSWGQA